MSNEILLRLTVEPTNNQQPTSSVGVTASAPTQPSNIGMHTDPEYEVQLGDLVLMFNSASDKAAFMADPYSQRNNRPGRFSQYGPAFLTQSTAGRALGDKKIAVSFGGAGLPPGSDNGDSVFDPHEYDY